MGPNALRFCISLGLIGALGVYAATVSNAPDLSGVSVRALLAIGLVLTFTIFLAALRLQLAVVDLGQHLKYRDCLAATAAGNAAGYIVFQLVGQIAARGAVLSRVGMSIEASALATLYERVVALGVSAVMAVSGGIYLFGHVGFDLTAGGRDLVTILASMSAVACVVAVLAWRDLITAHVLPVLSVAMVWRMARLAAVTLLIQGATLFAFVLAVQQFQQVASIGNLVAAASIVMFAAAIPISFAGWGVRELGAVAAFGAIGVSAGPALASSILIGLVSLVTVVVVAGATMLLALPGRRIARAAPVDSSKSWSGAVAWTLPLLTALFVFFQVQVPITGGFVNVSPADLGAMVCGVLLLLQVAADRTLRIRLGSFLWFVGLGSAAFLAAYLNGLLSFGGSHWATSKILGWFVLLSYAATGATIALYAGRPGIQRVAITMVVACCAIIAIEVARNAYGLRLWRHEGFAGNSNAFAFQITTCLAVGFATARRMRWWPVMAALLMLGILLTGSRSGIITFTAVAALAIALRPEQWLRTGAGLAVGVLLWLAWIFHPQALAWIFQARDGAADYSSYAPYSSSLRDTSGVIFSDQERWLSLSEALSLFLSRPIFGAGLGYHYGHVLRPDGTGLVIHSTPLWLAAEFGLVGTAVFVAFAIRWLRTAARWAWRGDDVAMMLMLGTATFALMGAVHDMFYQRSFWLLAGLAVPALVRLRRPPRPRAAQ